MIKIFIKYGLTAVLSILFLYAACGYNLAKYCCSTCEAEGIVALTSEVCHPAEESSCCSMLHENEISTTCHTDEYEHKSCELIHLKVDHSVVFSEEHKLAPRQLISIILLANYFDLNNANSILSHKITNPPDEPHPLAGRAMLSSNCVLRL